MEVLAIDLAAGEEALPVFSHEEEAEMFLGLWGWRSRAGRSGRVRPESLSRCSTGPARAWSALPWTRCPRWSPRGRSDS
jgi:hypothetical protein